MKALKTSLSIVFTIALTVILFVSAVELVLYGTDIVNREYEKYDVCSLINVTPEDLRQVNKEMYDYLHDYRDNLSDIRTTIGGEKDVLFFNEKECLHMADCKGIFMAGLLARRVAIAVAVICLLIFGFAAKESILGILRYSWQTILILLAAVGAFAVVVANSWETYFVLFHETFFNNDLWLLDPRTDRLINIMPEGYFMDLALICLITFFVMMGIILILSICVQHKKRA